MASILVTCEHASDYIPENYASRMNIPTDIEQHRVYDAGAIESAKRFTDKTGGDVLTFPFSRLLIDANRSLTNPKLFSTYSMALSEHERYLLIKDYYIHFRLNALTCIQNHPNVIHLSFHTFTPVMNGRIRDYDAGILYDPSRKKEAELCKEMIKRLNNSGVRTFANKPYKGTADGHTTALRKEFDQNKYIGIEIELSQRLDVTEMAEISDKIASFM